MPRRPPEQTRKMKNTTKRKGMVAAEPGMLASLDPRGTEVRHTPRKRATRQEGAQKKTAGGKEK